MRQLSTRKDSIGWVYILPKEVTTCLFKPPVKTFSTEECFGFHNGSKSVDYKSLLCFYITIFYGCRHAVNRYNFVYQCEFHLEGRVIFSLSVCEC